MAIVIRRLSFVPRRGVNRTKIAVALLTCNRPDYTRRTVESFVEMNRDQSRFVLLHGDDGSSDDTNCQLAASAGFKTIVRMPERQGWRVTRTALLWRAAKRAPWTLFLENDIETLRPFPWDLFDFVQKHDQVYCLRLYGRYKDAAKTDKCLATHKRRGHEPVHWRPFRNAPEKSQVGMIHWSAQPCVTRSNELVRHHKMGQEPGGLTVRVKHNVMAHFGYERTAPMHAEETVACL